jgi:peptidoglycan/LPS O-acetylase OafA/YrhL
MNNEKWFIDERTSAALDGLRGFSAFVVLLSHFNQIFILPVVGLNGPIHLIPSVLSSYAVLFFFVLSGFVIASSVVRNINKNSYFNSVDFLISRIARIYPPYLFALFFSFLVYFLIASLDLHGSESFLLDGDKYVVRDKVSAHYFNYITSALMLPGFINGMGTILMNGSLWSISYEFWLYMLMFLIALALNKKAWPLLVFFSILFFLGFTENYLFLFLGFIWLLGVVAFFTYYFFRSVFDKARIEFYLHVLSLIFSLFIVIVLYRASIDGSFGFLKLYSNGFSYLFGFLVISFLILFFSLYLIPLFSNSEYFKSMGKYSYTLYLIHFPVVLFAFSLFHEYFMSANIYERSLLFFILIGFVLKVSKLFSLKLENTRACKIWLVKFLSLLKVFYERRKRAIE